MNAYMVFANRHRAAVRRSHPSWTMAQVGSELGRLYRLEHGLTKKTKSPKRKSPTRKTKSPTRKTKSPKRKSPKRKSPKRKSPKRKSPTRKTKSPKRKSPKRKSPKRKSPARKTKSPKRGRGRKSKSPKRGRGRARSHYGGSQMGWGYNPNDTARLRQVLLQRLYGNNA